MKKIRIGLVSESFLTWRGGIEYLKYLTSALSALPAKARSRFEVYLLVRGKSDVDLLGGIIPSIKVIHCAGVVPQKEREHIFKRMKLDFIFRNCPAGGRKREYRSAEWIPDFQHKYLKKFFPGTEIQRRDAEFSCMADNADIIILSSRSVESDFHKFFPRSADKTRVLSFRASFLSGWYKGDPVAAQKAYNLPGRFFIVSNQFWQHKGHLLLFEALRILRMRQIYPVVVCTGSLLDTRNFAFTNTVLRAIHKLDLASQVYLLGEVPKIEQFQLMRRAMAIIQPSLFEGWSTVVEEGRCLGKPIILSDFPVHLEQDPPRSAFFARTSAAGLAKILAQWWKQLPPGPGYAQEKTAMAKNREEVKKFGCKFLEIVREAVSA